MAADQTPATAHDPDADIVIVDRKYVKCDGGGGPLGHPVSWLDMGEDRQVECKYCDRVFKLADGAAGAH